MSIAETLTPDSLEVFRMYAEDAPNWSGTPWVSVGNIDLTREQRGNLTDLVRKGLVVVNDYGDGDTYLTFTEAGQRRAFDLGIDLGL